MQAIHAELPRLSSEERVRVARALHDFTASQQAAATPEVAAQPRTFGLHAGAWRVAEDFDDPLLSITQSALDISPTSVGRVLLSSSSPDDDLLGEMLEGRA